MIDTDRLKMLAKEVKQKDVTINYLKRSIARAKDWTNIVASFSILNEHMQKEYNINLI